MMKKNKLLESLVRNVQESLKDNSSTQIHKNYKIRTGQGRQREIDILIEATVNSFPIIIAIECKASQRKVSVDKIEAFESKCKRLKKVDKKVVISTSGFQADAKNAALEFNILLYSVEEITKESIRDLLLTSSVGSIGTTSRIMAISINTPITSEQVQILKQKGIAYLDDTEIDLQQIVQDVLEEEGKKLDRVLAPNMDKLLFAIRNKYEFAMYHTIKLPGVYFRNGSENCPITSINVKVLCVIEKKIFDKQNYFRYQNEQSEEDLKIARHVFTDTQDIIDIIKSDKNGNIKYISCDKDGNFVQELEYMIKFDNEFNVIRINKNDL